MPETVRAQLARAILAAPATGSPCDTCWRLPLNAPLAEDACSGCWQHERGLPWAADARSAAQGIAVMSAEQRARLDAAVRRDFAGSASEGEATK